MIAIPRLVVFSISVWKFHDACMAKFRLRRIQIYYIQLCGVWCQHVDQIHQLDFATLLIYQNLLIFDENVDTCVLSRPLASPRLVLYQSTNNRVVICNCTSLYVLSPTICQISMLLAFYIHIYISQKISFSIHLTYSQHYLSKRWGRGQMSSWPEPELEWHPDLLPRKEE